MIVTARVLAKMRELKESGWDHIEQWNQQLDDQSVMKYIAKIQQEDGVSYDEAWRLVREEPKYSMGYKMCSPAVLMMLTMRGGKDRFRKMLTDEERKIFDEEVDGKINFRKAVRHELKHQKKGKHGAVRAQGMGGPGPEEGGGVRAVHRQAGLSARDVRDRNAERRPVQEVQRGAPAAHRLGGAPAGRHGVPAGPDHDDRSCDADHVEDEEMMDKRKDRKASVALALAGVMFAMFGMFYAGFSDELVPMTCFTALALIGALIADCGVKDLRRMENRE